MLQSRSPSKLQSTHLFQFNMSPSSSSMPGYPYGSSGSYAGAMYAAATSSTTKESSLVAAGDSINSLRLKAKQHSSSSSPTAIASASTTSYYPASVSPGKSNSSESPNLTMNPDLFSSGGGGNASSSTNINVAVTSESVWRISWKLLLLLRRHTASSFAASRLERLLHGICLMFRTSAFSFLKYVEPNNLCFCESSIE